MSHKDEEISARSLPSLPPFSVVPTEECTRQISQRNIPVQTRFEQRKIRRLSGKRLIRREKLVLTSGSSLFSISPLPFVRTDVLAGICPIFPILTQVFCCCCCSRVEANNGSPIDKPIRGLKRASSPFPQKCSLSNPCERMADDFHWPESKGKQLPQNRPSFPIFTSAQFPRFLRPIDRTDRLLSSRRTVDRKLQPCKIFPFPDNRTISTISLAIHFKFSCFTIK